MVKHSATAKYERRGPSCGAQRRSRHGNTLIPMPNPPKTQNSFSAALKTRRAARCYSFVVRCCLCLTALLQRANLQRVARFRNCSSQLFLLDRFVLFESDICSLSTFSFCAGSGRADGVCALQIGPHKSSTRPRKPVKALIVLDHFRLFSLRAFRKITCSPPQKYQAQLLSPDPLYLY